MGNFCLNIGSPEFIGYFICLPLSQLFISLNINALWKKLDFGKKTNKKKQDLFRSKWHPLLIGYLDSVLYLTVFLVGKPEFIIAWLTIKTVPQIPYWQKIKSLYNLFLIGNSLILIFSFFTYQIVQQLKVKQYLSSEWIIAILVVIISNLIMIIISYNTNEIDIELQKKELGLIDSAKKS